MAWEPLGWAPAFFAEVEPFPNAVLAHHWPHVPNLGDITADTFTDWARQTGPIDILVGGTPCQGFSTSGQRGGLGDPRSALAVRFLNIARDLRPAWVVWENVPGCLTTAGGRDFGAFLGQVADLGYRWAYRVLDARFFGIPQRRRRVFLVASLGTGRPDLVLFEPDGEGRDSPPGSPAEQEVAATAPVRSGSLSPGYGRDAPLPAAVSENNRAEIRLMRAAPCVETGGGKPGQGTPVVLAYQCHGNNVGPMGTLRKGDGGLTSGVPFVASRVDGRPVVRRFTPRECERLQGLPDDHTLVLYRKKPASDGPRYKSIGNSIAVPVLRWIGRRLAAEHARATAG